MLLAPQYYGSFSCIADKCKHSCCIGWEICIDSDTLAKYEKLPEIISTVNFDQLPHFSLSKTGRCPHLSDRGLCNIISRYGEDHLCEICRLHPRFFRENGRARIVGLGMSCEEACRLILSSQDYSLSQISKDVTETSDDSDPFPLISKAYELLSDSSLPYDLRRARLENMLGKTVNLPSDDEWRNILSELEYLDENNREKYLSLAIIKETPPELQPMLERALAYFLLRYLSLDDSSSLRSTLALSLMLERHLASLLAQYAKADACAAVDLARAFSSELEYSEENIDYIKFELSLLNDWEA